MQNKIDKKYYVWIWLGLIFACVVRNIYGIYCDIYDMASAVAITRSEILSSVMNGIIEYALVPVVIVFVLALIMYYIAARRHSNYISRNDFCYWIMLFAIGPKLLTGIVECFAILDPTVYFVSSVVLESMLSALAYLLMFIFIFARKYNLNPVEKRNSFSILSTVYMVVYGINAFYYAMIGLGGDDIRDLLVELGVTITEQMADVFAICSTVAVCIYIGYLVAVIVLNAQYRKLANEFRDEDTRENYYHTHPNTDKGYHQRDDVFDTFEEFEKEHTASSDDDSNGNVFDEFDI